MQSTAKALLLIAGIQSPFSVASNHHSDEILKACPNLKRAQLKHKL